MTAIIVTSVIVVVLAGMLAWVIHQRRRHRARTAVANDQPSELDALIKDGKLREAAALAMLHGHGELALQLYLRASQPEQAAGIALQLGDVMQAAHLYERAGNVERAAQLYEQAGMSDRAAGLRREQVGVLPTDRIETMSRGRELEVAYRNAAASADRSDAQLARRQSLARAAADALIADGEVRRAADIFRDAMFDDEAIHLYVNVLGEPAVAAPILAGKGAHERAAELYELAGQTERAAFAWVDVARAAPRPEIFLDRIERLSPDILATFLDHETRTRSVDASNAELFYRLASLVAKAGDSGRALELLRQLKASIGAYKEVDRQIQELDAGKHMIEPTMPLATYKAEPAPPAPAVITAAQLQALTDQVATITVEQVKGRADAQGASAPGPNGSELGTPASLAAGLELAPVSIDLLLDPSVEAARGGPTVEALQGFIAGRPCDLQNIEVFYRVGLALLARGQFDGAMKAFDTVENASPGYRDAWRRADAIRAWTDALGARASRVVGRYQLRGVLGQSAVAVVYRAYDALLGRDVALKVVTTELPDVMQRDARAAATLSHPNIATIHDVGSIDGRAYVCTEFVDGRSLQNLMTQPPGLTIVEILRAARQVLDGLGYAHERQILHRGITPANILRATTGVTKLVDFGTACTDKASPFLAPEQRGDGPVDQRADLFAIAATLYRSLSGRVPEGAPVPLSAHVPAIPAVLEAVIMSALSPDRAKRPRAAAELAAPVTQVLDAVARSAGKLVTPAPGPERLEIRFK
ncbi:MAG: serine/threonine-protein kinase [Kofleriaceae bacterium]